MINAPMPRVLRSTFCLPHSTFDIAPFSGRNTQGTLAEICSRAVFATHDTQSPSFRALVPVQLVSAAAIGKTSNSTFSRTASSATSSS